MITTIILYSDLIFYVDICETMSIGFIDISGASNSTASEEQLDHLDIICEMTQSVVDDVTGGSDTSDQPTMKPIETVSCC